MVTVIQDPAEMSWLPASLERTEVLQLFIHPSILKAELPQPTVFIGSEEILIAKHTGQIKTQGAYNGA